MDFYEELGISRTASEGEIRQAYRKLARILHPDQQADEQTRRLANSQMKRLNSMLEMLLDPECRREYNRSLEFRPQAGVRVAALLKAPHPTFENAAARLRSRLLEAGPAVWIWPVTFLVGFSGLIAFFSWNSAEMPSVASARPTIVSGPPKTPQQLGGRERQPHFRSRPKTSGIPREHKASRSRESVRSTGASLSSAAPLQEISSYNLDETNLDETYKLDETEAAVASLPAARADSHVIEVTNPPSSPPQLPIRNTHRSSGSSLAGEWLYLPDRKDLAKGLYPPEYIEMHISEESGLIRGRYDGRYKIADQAISPMVSFQFEGPADGAPMTFNWSGPGGGKGTVTLKLVSAGLMEVDWTATKLGAELELASGSATLMRWEDSN